jgi:transcriptional regulator with XRE-family HTH domain
MGIFTKPTSEHDMDERRHDTPAGHETPVRAREINWLSDQPDLEKKIGLAVRSLREKRNLYRREISDRLGLHENVYGRIETGKARLTVSRLIAVCSILEANPMEVLFDAAPHLFSPEPATAQLLYSVMSHLVDMEEKSLDTILKVVQHFNPD